MKSSRRALLKGETRHARQLPTLRARTCPGSLSSIYKKKESHLAQACTEGDKLECFPYT